MRHIKIFRPDYRIFLLLAVLCAVPVMLPVKPGIRIPVNCRDGVMGYIDDSGSMVLPAWWNHATPFNESGVGYVSNKSHKVWSITRSGKRERYAPLYVSLERVHPNSLPLGPDSHGMILHRTPGAVHWTLADGSQAFPGTWDRGHPFQGEHPAAVSREGRWGFINRKGETTLPYEWDDARSFDKDGLACVCLNGQWGAIDTGGNIVVPLHFSEMTGFDDAGMCGVTMNSGSGFINREGRVVIPLRYVNISPFDDGGLARVVQAENWHHKERRVGWIDRSGRTVIPFDHEGSVAPWQFAFANHPRVLLVQQGARSGLRDREGRWLVPLATGGLRLIKDPMAPEREWFVRYADFRIQPKDSPSAPFQPACYDGNGREIWSGWRFTWWEPFMWTSIALCALTAGDWIRKRTRGKRNTALMPEPS